MESLASAHSDDPREKYRYLLDNFEKIWRESNGHKFAKFGEDYTKEYLKKKFSEKLKNSLK